MEIDDSMKVSIQEILDGFTVTTDIFGDTTRRFVNVRGALEEQAIRNALIRLGWTPPERRAEDEDQWIESWWRLTAEGPIYERNSLNAAPSWVTDAIRDLCPPTTTDPDTRPGSEGQGA